MSKKVSTLFSLIVLLGLVLSACAAPPAPTERWQRRKPRPRNYQPPNHQPPNHRASGDRRSDRGTSRRSFRKESQPSSPSRYPRRHMERRHAADFQGCCGHLGHFMDAQERHMGLAGGCGRQG